MPLALQAASGLTHRTPNQRGPEACAVAPTAITAATAAVFGLSELKSQAWEQLSKKEAIQMPGRTRGPNRSVQASASPAAGNTGLA